MTFTNVYDVSLCFCAKLHIRVSWALWFSGSVSLSLVHAWTEFIAIVHLQFELVQFVQSFAYTETQLKWLYGKLWHDLIQHDSTDRRDSALWWTDTWRGHFCKPATHTRLFYHYITVPCEKTCACIVCALVVYLNILRVTEEMLCLQILYY